jgi:arylsulfatase A-like enzyme
MRRPARTIAAFALAAACLCNTVAIFVSDNGYLWGEHGMNETKRLPYQQSVRVPLYVHWPGRVAAGATDSRLAGGIDLTPTILDAAGLPTDTLPVDGVSLRVRRGTRPSAPGALPRRGRPGLRQLVLLTQNFEYVEWYADDRKGTTPIELADLGSAGARARGCAWAASRVGESGPSRSGSPTTSGLRCTIRW